MDRHFSSSKRRISWNTSSASRRVRRDRDRLPLAPRMRRDRRLGRRQRDAEALELDGRQLLISARSTSFRWRSLRPRPRRPAASSENRSSIRLVGTCVEARRTGAGRPAGRREPDQEWLVGLIHDFGSSPGARYRELALGLRAAIRAGEVPVGARLPPQRELARLLSIGRTTVVAAYNLLHAESLLVMRQGAGTWVARRPAPGRRADRP